MAQTTVLLGSNIGLKKLNIDRAQQLILHECGDLLLESSFYKTQAWGMENLLPEESIFFNKVISLKTSFEPYSLLKKFHTIENTLGRTRSNENHYMSRTIDIDILFYDQEIIQTEELIVPHPRIQIRRFVLQPLAEIMPQFIHPVLNKSIQTLLNECEDKLQVEKILDI